MVREGAGRRVAVVWYKNPPNSGHKRLKVILKEVDDYASWGKLGIVLEG